MSRLYVVGGQQRHARSVLEHGEHWYKYQKGLVLAVDSVTRGVTKPVEYVSPDDVCAVDDPAVLFKSGTLVNNILYVCTQTELLTYQVPEFLLCTYLSLPSFNDVHHVYPSNTGTLLVAISGLDLVQEIALDGRIVREWDTTGAEPWTRFSHAIDYRRIASTKPHQSHPNHIFLLEEEIWVTRFEQRDAISLDVPSRRIGIDIERCHDGVVGGDSIYFTTVNGCVVIVNRLTLAIERTIDLNRFYEDDVQLGWCRGLAIDGDHLWIGFSKLRVTRIRENISWVRLGFRRNLPTRIICYNMQSEQLVDDFELQSHGLDAVFSIFVVNNDSTCAVSP